MHISKRSALLAIATFVAMLSAACSDSFFDVDRPDVIDAESLDPVVAIEEFAHSAYQDFLVAYGGVIVYGAWFTNEARVGDTFPTRNEFGRRSISPRNTALENEVWAPLGRALATTHQALEMMGETFEEWRGNPLIARVSLAAGFTSQLMAESFCEGVVEPSGPSASTDEMLAKAIEHFERVLTVVGDDNEDDELLEGLLNAARVGLARAYLQAGEMATAAEIAAKVPDDFTYEAKYFNDPGNRGRLGNNVYYFNTSRISLVVGPEWREMADLGDSRISYDTIFRKDGEQATAQDGTTPMFAQRKYPEWDSPIRLASGLEARYIEVEARRDLEEIIDFINWRRAQSGQGGIFSTSSLEEAIMELMEQRGRDFWLEGKRLGDWRRHGSSDHFPYIIEANGEYYKQQSGSMGDAVCLPITEFERDANPNF